LPRAFVGGWPVPGYGTAAWQAGDQWRGQHQLPLPASLPTGDYDVWVGVQGSGAPAQVVGRLTVTAPERMFEQPAFAEPVGATFGAAAELVGYAVQAPPASQSLTLTLVWRALSTPETGLKVFVHLADPSGRIWAQSDAVPAGWTRPTTGWVEDEYIVDAHTLALQADRPAGDYTLWVGLYDPVSGARLPAAGPGAAPDDRVALEPMSLP
jgi:hypothetical protein